MPPANYTTRLAKLLGMTGSTHDGEALNAIRMAGQLIAQLGLTWEQVLNWRDDAIERAFQDGERSSNDRLEKALAAVEKARQEGRRAGYAEGYAKGWREAQNAPRARPRSWQAIVREMLDQQEDLSKWEEGFLQSFARRHWHTPTDRQRAVLERIAGKLGIDIPDA